MVLFTDADFVMEITLNHRARISPTAWRRRVGLIAGLLSFFMMLTGGMGQTAMASHGDEPIAIAFDHTSPPSHDGCAECQDCLQHIQCSFVAMLSAPPAMVPSGPERLDAAARQFVVGQSISPLHRPPKFR
jgi:hypothetical protein